ncbi:MAG: dihydroorotate dehydrogenase electron transfer subunit [Clostridiales bacterium]|nr:dihydroorotate dehydrogenase electron transfer subunit [Clostridiales bacterium]
MKKVKAKVISQAELSDDIYDMWIESDLAATAKAGQFICVYPHNESILLPRPISICEADREKNILRIVYRVVGKGTKELSYYRDGGDINILGNLGNGFPLEEVAGKHVVLMGGGIGIPPMLQLAKDLKRAGEAEEITAIAGYRNDRLFLKEDMQKYVSVHVATEDGSVGTKGNVMDAMSALGIRADVIMACGPMPMLRAIKQYAKKEGCKAYISLEERMACGVGACLGCVCKTKEKDEHSHVNNARICTDGPVFNAQDVEI